MRKTKDRTLDPQYKNRGDANRPSSGHARRRESFLGARARVPRPHQADCKCATCYKWKTDRTIIDMIGKALPKIPGHQLAWLVSMVNREVCGRLTGID